MTCERRGRRKIKDGKGGGEEKIKEGLPNSSLVTDVMYIHTHTNVCTRTHIHIYIHTNIHTRTHTCIHTNTHNCLFTYVMYVYTNTHTQIDMHTHAHAHTHVHMHNCLSMYVMY